PTSSLFPYPPLFRSGLEHRQGRTFPVQVVPQHAAPAVDLGRDALVAVQEAAALAAPAFDVLRDATAEGVVAIARACRRVRRLDEDRKSTRLNSSHVK